VRENPLVNPIDAVRLALEARVVDAGELRALAERCERVGEEEVAEVARGFAALAEAEGTCSVGAKKNLDTI
jgi:hypothetical protein